MRWGVGGFSFYVIVSLALHVSVELPVLYALRVVRWGIFGDYFVALSCRLRSTFLFFFVFGQKNWKIGLFV